MPIIHCDKLSKTFRVAAKQPGIFNSFKHFFHRKFRDIHAVREVAFDIEPGEFVGFLGPNGAGKTTTLKMLTGLIHPTGGDVQVGGHTPFKRRADFLRKITLVMGQKQQLIWDLPALDSLRINAAVYEISEEQFKRRVDELADMLDIREQLSQPVRKLSLGQRMKTELLAALLHRPDILFLDEPTLGLDVNAQASVREFLREYNRRYQATVLLTSHYMADITALCERVMLIHEGSLMYDGSLQGILDRFAPVREIKLEMKDHENAPDLNSYGDLVECDGRSCRLLVERPKLTATVSKLLADIPLEDLTITDPPIEEIIGRIFAEGIDP